VTTHPYRTEGTRAPTADWQVMGLGIIAGELLALLWLGWLLTSVLRANPAATALLPATLQRLAPGGGALLRLSWPLAADTPAFWYMARSAGLVSYILLWAGTVGGLLTKTKLARAWLPGPAAVSWHEFLSLTALVLASLHGLALLGDRYIQFDLFNVVFPFAATYRTGWVGLGQLGFYLSAAVAVSFYVRQTIGARLWRGLHYLSFVAYVLVVVHGITSGTDTSAVPVQLMYLVTGGAVLFLVYYRLLAGRPRATA
jgi:predicted ferric reductase